MPKISAFQKNADLYDTWFQTNHWTYAAELQAIRTLLPTGGRKVEIGVGTGRFAGPLEIPVGLEPSDRMAALASARGIMVVAGVAEHLPFQTAAFDSVVLITTICFVDDILQTFREAYRILADGCCLVAMLDKNSRLGRYYEQHRRQSNFYYEATFFSVDTTVALLRQAGFYDFRFTQTIYRDPAEINSAEPVDSGYGRGLFVVIRGRKEV